MVFFPFYFLQQFDFLSLLHFFLFFSGLVSLSSAAAFVSLEMQSVFLTFFLLSELVGGLVICLRVKYGGDCSSAQQLE